MLRLCQMLEWECAMSDARAYKMVYRLSVVSGYRFVLVVDSVRRGGQM